jgi:hypothetical protein
VWVLGRLYSCLKDCASIQQDLAGCASLANGVLVLPLPYGWCTGFLQYASSPKAVAAFAGFTGLQPLASKAHAIPVSPGGSTGLQHAGLSNKEAVQVIRMLYRPLAGYTALQRAAFVFKRLCHRPSTCWLSQQQHSRQCTNGTRGCTSRLQRAECISTRQCRISKAAPQGVYENCETHQGHTIHCVVFRATHIARHAHISDVKRLQPALWGCASPDRPPLCSALGSFRKRQTGVVPSLPNRQAGLERPPELRAEGPRSFC